MITCITVLLVVIVVCITVYSIHYNSVVYSQDDDNYQKLKDIKLIATNEYNRNQNIINDCDDDDNQLKIATENLSDALNTIIIITRNI